jgi:hypothetical protein
MRNLKFCLWFNSDNSFELGISGAIWRQINKLTNKFYIWNVLYGNNYKLHIKRQSYPCNRPWRPVWLWDVETPTFSVDTRLTDGGEVVCLTRRKDSLYLLRDLSRPQGHSVAGRIRLIERSGALIEDRTRDLHSIVTQAAALPRAKQI